MLQNQEAMKSKHFTLLVLFSVFVHSTNAQSNSIGSGIDLQFPGFSNSYVDLGDVYNDLDFPFTIEVWLKLKEYPPIHGGIFFSDNSAGNYYGIYFNVEQTGRIRIEFGDGFGAGSQFRRGFQTNNEIPLNKWIHVAVSCTSITDIKVYFNGVNQLLSPTDGGSTITDVIHSSDPARIGWGEDAFGLYPLNGQLDEIRLWNVAEVKRRSGIICVRNLAELKQG